MRKYIFFSNNKDRLFLVRHVVLEIEGSVQNLTSLNYLLHNHIGLGDFTLASTKTNSRRIDSETDKIRSVHMIFNQW